MRAFLTIWGGQVVSLVGTAMTRFALLIWAWEVTGKATTLALLMFFQIGSTVLISPYAGTVVDRFNRKKVMILSDLAAGSATLGLLVLLLTGHLAIPHLFIAAAIAGAAEAFQFPAYSAAVTLLLPKRHYARASGMVSFAQSGSMILGPPLAGALLPFIGYTAILAIDLSTVAVAIVALLLVHVPEPEREDERGASFWQRVTFGFRYIFGRRGLLGLQTLFAVGNFLLVFGVVLRAPLILARTGGDELALGQVMAAAGIGGALGGATLAAWGGPRRRIVGVLTGWSLSSFGNVLLGAGRAFWTWTVGAFVYPFCLTLTNGLNQAIWQAKVPPALQGRVFSARLLIAQASLLPAMLVAGPLADRWLTPAMTEGGSLHDALAGWLGSGAAGGMGLLIAGTATLALVASLVGATSRSVRNVERDLPDHDAVVEAASTAPATD
ncbi:MAG: MFS transporter [Acidobacteriota bacterium]